MPRRPAPAKPLEFAPVVPADLAVYLAVGGAVGVHIGIRQRRRDAILLPAGRGYFWVGTRGPRSGRVTGAAARPVRPERAIELLRQLGVRRPDRLLWVAVADEPTRTNPFVGR